MHWQPTVTRSYSFTCVFHRKFAIYEFVFPGLETLKVTSLKLTGYDDCVCPLLFLCYEVTYNGNHKVGCMRVPVYRSESCNGRICHLTTPMNLFNFDIQSCLRLLYKRTLSYMKLI